jgi:hypothetical protein
MRLTLLGPRRCAAVVVVCAGFAQTALGQYASDFESLSLGLLTGQDGYYLPNATSADYTVESYAGQCYADCDGNSTLDVFDFLCFQDAFVMMDPYADCDGNTVLDVFDFLCFQDAFVTGCAGAIPSNPTGGDQFVVGVGPAGGIFARAQRDIMWGSGVWDISFDFLAGTTATVAQNNLGSFSIQPFPGSASFIQLFEYMTGSTTEFRASLIGFTAAGVQFGLPYPVPGPEWENLSLNKWYRLNIVVDFDSNTVIESTITDIESGSSTTAAVTDVYLEGGSAGGTAVPTGFRFFGGTSVAGNYTAWDNVSISQR